MPQRIPAKWFYACVESVSQDPRVTDPKAVCAWNWHYWMTPERRLEILRGTAIFDPDIDIKRKKHVVIKDPYEKERFLLLKRMSSALKKGDMKTYNKLIKRYLVVLKLSEKHVKRFYYR